MIRGGERLQLPTPQSLPHHNRTYLLLFSLIFELMCLVSIIANPISHPKVSVFAHITCIVHMRDGTGDENMPPGTPCISFVFYLTSLLEICTYHNGWMPPAFGLYYAGSPLYSTPYSFLFIKFTLEHEIDHRIWNKVPSRGTRVAWLQGYRDLISAVSWMWFDLSRKIRLVVLLSIAVWGVSMSWITWYGQFFLVWSVWDVIRGSLTCLELMSEIVEKRPKSGIFVGGCHVQSHIWAWKPGFQERQASDSKTFECA